MFLRREALMLTKLGRLDLRNRSVATTDYLRLHDALGHQFLATSSRAGQFLLACKAAEGRAVLSARPPPGSLGLMMLSIARHQIMIRNGLYPAETRFLDGVDAYNRHVMVLRDGTMRGGGGFLLHRRKLHLFRRQVER